MNRIKSIFINFLKCNDEERNRSTVLDSIKGIAILGIILVHSKLVYMPGIIGKICSSGSRGVQIFFIISSLLTFYSIDKFKNKSDNNIKKWYFNKFLRLIPIYYLSLLTYFCINGFDNTYWAGNHDVNIFTYLSNMLFLHGLNPWHINAININWYIGTLALFIVLAPLIYKMINNLQKSFVFFIITWIIAQFFSCITIDLYNGSDAYVWNAYWNTFSIVSELPVLALGLILYYLIYKERIVESIKNNLSKRGKLTINLITIIICLLIFEKICTGGSIISYSILFGIFIFVQLISSNIFINNKIFCFLGKYSYGIYLFSVLLTSFLGKFNFKHESTLYSDIIGLLIYVIGVIFSLIVSYVCTNFVEKPIVSKFKKE